MKRALLAVALCALLTSAKLTGASHEAAIVLRVSTPAELQSALSRARSGDTIRLARGEYAGVTVTRRFSGVVTIVGSRAARLPGIAFVESANVTLRGVSVLPIGSQRVTVQIRRSHDVTLDDVLIDGRSEAAGAWVATDATDSDITIERSELSNCGASNVCIQPAAQNLRILDNYFHDCLDCDFIRGGGRGGGSVLIRGNRFDRAIEGSCQGGQASCNHNDFIQIMGGGPWKILRNRFGDRNNGAASVFISTGSRFTKNLIHDVTVASNIFKGNAGFFGIEVAAAGHPRNVSIVNNTILSGTASGVRIAHQWQALPLEARPLVANNILAVSNGSDCFARTSHNLVEEGRPCKRDLAGSANLNWKGVPTKRSTLVLGKADPLYAPLRDYYGRRLPAVPNIGAVQSVQAP